MKLINIKTFDSEIIEVEWGAARQSLIIRKMLEILEEKMLQEKIIEEKIYKKENIIPISNEKVTGSVFKKALVWMENNRGYPDFKEDIDDKLLKKKKWNQLNEWENQYIEMPVEDMIPLLVCGDYLEIEGLVKLMIKAIALQINGKRSEEEIRKTYKIEDPKLLRQLRTFLD